MVNHELARFLLKSCVTFQERLMQLKEEISSAKALYSALHKEIDKRVLTGGDIYQLKTDRDEMFNFYNCLLNEHQNILQYLKENNLKARSMIPKGFGSVR